jgi:HK97 family phage portal protein
MTTIIGPSGEPDDYYEVTPGGGDLRGHSVPFTVADTMGSFVGSRPLSYAKVFAEQPWVSIAVMRLLTWAIRVPLKAYRREDGESDKQRLSPREHSLAALLHEPWPRATQADLVQALLGPKLVHGNSLLDIEDGAGDKLRAKEIDWRTVMPNRVDQTDANSEIVGWKVYGPTGGARNYSAETVLHLRWWSPLGNVGVSPLQPLRSTITAETAAVEWLINNLQQSWRPNGLVEISDEALKLDPDKLYALYQKSLTEFRKEYGGQRNAGKVPLIPPGMKWTDAKPTTAVEAELIDQRLVNRNEVAAVYMIPPPMIGQLERSTFNNVTTLREMAYTDALAPPLVLIEQAINSHIVNGLLREPDVFVEFDFGLILRGDRLKEIQALREGVGMGIYTPNEARGALNLPESGNPLADEQWMPTNNLAPISASGDEEP